MKGKTGFHYIDNFFIQKKIPEMNRQVAILFFKIYLLQIFIFIIGIYIGFYLLHRGDVRLLLAEEVEHVQLAELILTKNLKSISDDLFLLQKDNYVKSYIETSDTESLARLKKRFLFFAQSRAIYHQVRLLDERGMEIIRINNNGKIEAVPYNELQDKSDRYYFHETKKMGENELFISQLDLNIEYGKIDVPHVPTIRLCIPLFSKDGENRGIILLNYDAGSTLSEFAGHFSSTFSKQYSIVSNDGNYILSHDLKKAWDSEYPFSEEQPEVWKRMLKEDSFQIRLTNGVFTVLAFKPYERMRAHLSKFLKNVKLMGVEGDSVNRKVAVVSFISENNIKFNFLSYQSTKSFLFYLVFQCFAAVIIWTIIKSVVLKKEFGLWMEFFFQGIEKNPAAIILTDQEGDILYANSKFIESSGYSQDEVYLQNPRVLKSGEMSGDGYKKLWATISSGKTWSGEFHNKKKDGSLYWVFASISPIINQKGEIERYFGIQKDISVRKKLQGKLEKQASTDSLTGLDNRRSLLSKMEVEIERCKRQSHVFSLFMIDIDFFKKVNDVYGHQVGDMVLKDLSSILKKNARVVDLCARFGGEEFVVVLPETAKEKGAVMAERLRKEVEKRQFAIDGGAIQYTLSIGVTEWKEGEELESTIARADESLYRAKNEGRNRIIVS